MEFQKEPQLRTARLTLRGITEGDQQNMIVLLTHPQVGKTYMVPRFTHEDEAVALFQRLKGISHDETRFFYGIEFENRLVGMIHTVDISGAAVELGYAIHPDHWGKGIATEALGAAMEALFRAGFETVMAGAFEHNAASIRCMEKCGMTRLNKEETIAYRGTEHRCVYYGKHK